MQDDLPLPTHEYTSPEEPAAAPLPFWTWQRMVFFTACLVGSVVGGAGFGAMATFMGEMPLASDLRAFQPSLTTKMYDCNGHLITELFTEQRTLIRLDNVPDHLQKAVIAIEDNSFYQHPGIQVSGIIRSVMVNVLHKRYQQGGSTITQQLARNMFLTRRKTIERKIKEVILALQIEHTYTKREILEMYLNQIYFGNGAYGVESAARAYFGKHIQDLDLAECALLAGLPRAPNTYNPYRNVERATRRRNLVLAQMQHLGFITAQEAAAAHVKPIALASVEVSQAPYFVEYVRQQLENRYGGSALYKGGMKVYTTLDMTVQQMAQDSVNEGMVDAEKIILPRMPKSAGHIPETLQCALMVSDPATGEIKAMIGGRNFQESKFNRAVQAQRQPGSSFKPFIYATAFAKGFTQADLILDAPVVFKTEQGRTWKPENFSSKFEGLTCLRSALTHSRNIVAVKLLDKVGIENVVETAHRMGIASVLNPYLTLALGASEVNLMEMVSSYGTLANHGIHAEPLSIVRVEDAEGNVLEENASFKQEGLDETTAYVLTDAMENVINAGTGYTIRNMGFKYPAAGKTGTTNDYTDAWFIGFTTEYVAGVWLGLDSHRSLGRGVTGGMVAAPIWGRLMMKIYANHAPANFEKPNTVTNVTFCRTSGLLANPECEKFATTGAFAVGTAPTKHCDLHVAGTDANALGNINLNLAPDMVDLQPNSPAAAAVKAKPGAAKKKDLDTEERDSEKPDDRSVSDDGESPANKSKSKSAPAKTAPAAPRQEPPML
jgi:penicillin-binding protein 1A